MKILGLDIGANSVKALWLEANFRSHELKGWRQEPLGPTHDGEEPVPLADRLRPALESLAAADILKADSIICAMPGASVATHLVTLPFNDARRIEQTLPFELEGLIPFDLEDVVFDGHVVSKAPGKTELLVAVARHEDVKSLLEVLASFNIDPAVVTFSAAALSSLWTERYLEAAAPVSLEEGVPAAPPLEAIVDIGAERTDVVLCRGGQLQFARTFSHGGNDLTRSIMRATGLPFEAAELEKRSLIIGEGGDPTVLAAADQALSLLTRELRATFAGHASRTRQSVTSVHLAGGGARLRGLDQMLSTAFGIPVQPLELSGAQTFPVADELQPGALSFALALRGLNGRDTPRLTFRKGEFATAQGESNLKQLIAPLALMAAVLLVLFGFSAWARLSALEKQEQALDSQLCDVTQKILGKCETDYRVALGRLRGGGSVAANVPQVGASDVMLVVVRAFPADGGAVLNELDVVDEVVRLRGDAKSYEAVDVLVEKLQSDSCFGEVKKGRLVKDKDNRIDFDLDAKYVCGRGGRKAGT